MSNQFVGALMMATAVIWLLAGALRAISKRQKEIHTNVFVAAILLAFWMAGRAIAGKSMIELLLP